LLFFRPTDLQNDKNFVSNLDKILLVRPVGSQNHERVREVSSYPCVALKVVPVNVFFYIVLVFAVGLGFGTLEDYLGYAEHS
jgi:hypothetical protein